LQCGIGVPEQRGVIGLAEEEEKDFVIRKVEMFFSAAKQIKQSVS